LYENFESISVRLPYNEGALIALFHDQGQVHHVEHDRKDVLIQGKIPSRLIARYKPFVLV
jgi:GTP-binding protein HflX